MQLVIQLDGSIRCLYDESLALEQIGQLQIQRASHVEPDLARQWHADLSPVGGPMLGPFAHRSQALAAEQEWLEANWLTSTCTSRDCRQNTPRLS